MLFCEVLVHIFCLFSMTFSVFFSLITGILYICPGYHAPLSVTWVADVFSLFWACLHTICGVSDEHMLLFLVQLNLLFSMKLMLLSF